MGKAKLQEFLFDEQICSMFPWRHWNEHQRLNKLRRMPNPPNPFDVFAIVFFLGVGLEKRRQLLKWDGDLFRTLRQTHEAAAPCSSVLPTKSVSYVRAGHQPARDTVVPLSIGPSCGIDS